MTTELLPKLKSCPFCGGKPKLMAFVNPKISEQEPSRFAVKCGHCRISTPELRNKNAPIDKWNTRHD